MRLLRELSQRAQLVRAFLACGLLVGCYYLVPIEPAVSSTERWVRSGFLVVGAAALAVLIGRMVGRLQHEQPGSRPANLLVALFAGVVLFALIDYQIAVSMPGEFVRLETKTDALYFAVSTLTTVGYGDVHAAGQLGRGIVIVQQLFNLAVLATGGSVLLNWLNRARSPADR